MSSVNRGAGDWAWACIAAALLLGVAAFVVFVVHPGGPQGQVAWYGALLPGSFVGVVVLSYIQGFIPHAQRIAYLCLMVLFSFLWYFLIAYIVIKIVRMAAGAKKT